MTNEEKQILLKDLCARLPYGVKYNYGGNEGCDYTMDRISLIAIDDAFPIEDIKPYLRPLSSMTEEEKKEFDEFVCIDEEAWNGDGIQGYINQAEIMSDGIDYLLAHHFDYRGLIEKGLAIEAPKDMYSKGK